MKKLLSKQQIEQQSQQYFHESIENMDSIVTNRLRESRHLALQNNSNPLDSSRYPRSQWVGAVTTIVLILAVYWQVDHKIPEMNDDFVIVEEMMQWEENQDLLNDLDFYQWLEKNRKRGELA